MAIDSNQLPIRIDAETATKLGIIQYRLSASGVAATLSDAIKWAITHCPLPPDPPSTER